MNDELNDIVKKAQAGDRLALEQIARRVQDRIYRLARRILVNPEDALEATQEILIVIITKLSTFEGRSSFGTWVYRVATNYLLTAKKVADRDLGLNFEIFEADMENGLVVDPVPAADDAIMLNELRMACTTALLLCLDMKHRLAYVLGDVLELDHVEASNVLNISKENFRKRLSRARKDIVAFTSRSCGIANDNAKCSCPRRLPAAKALGRVQRDNLAYAVEGAPSYQEVKERVSEVVGELKVLKLQTAMPSFRCPEDLGSKVARIVHG